jgi:hypothetical protein
LTIFDNNLADIYEFADYYIAALPYFIGENLITTINSISKTKLFEHLDNLGEFYGHDARI